MLLRRRDVERWMSYRHLPEELRRYVSTDSKYVFMNMFINNFYL